MDSTGHKSQKINYPVQPVKIWSEGVVALSMLGLDVTSQMLHHSLRTFYACDVYIKDEWNGVETTGTDRINGDLVVYTLRNDHVINNEIDWLKKCADSSSQDSIYWSGVLTLNSTTDTHLSFNNATVTIAGERQEDNSWITRVVVEDVYDFAPERLENIDSIVSAVGGAAGTLAWLSQAPVVGAIKTYSIKVEFLTER